MEKKDKLYHFKSYEEINDYLSCHFPTEVYLPKVCSAVIRNGMVVAQREYCNQSVTVADDVRTPRFKYSDASDAVVLGAVRDFDATDFATIHDHEPVCIHAASMMEGLCRAGDHLASKMSTDGKETREYFSAREIAKPALKGGAKVKYPENTSYIYRIKAPAGTYDVAALSLFDIIERAELAESIGPAKRHKFRICQAESGERTLLARFRFDADRMIPKMKACCSKDNPQLVFQQPAIDIKRGVMVATNGRILAMHKLSGFSVETLDEKTIKDRINDTSDNLCVFLPCDIVSMKGRIRVDVTAATWENEQGNTMEGIRVLAVDGNFKSAEINQCMHYPNYKGVVWRKQGATVPVDGSLVASVRQVAAGLTKNDSDGNKVVVMDAPRGSETMQLSRRDIYDETRTQSTAQLPGKSGGILLGANSDCLLAALAFEPKEICCYGPGNQMVFIADSTRVLVMPMLMNDEDYKPLGSADQRDGDYFDVTAGSTSYYKLPANDFEEWLSCGAGASDSQAPVKVKVKVKKPKPVASPVAVTATQTVADRFRARLRSAMGIAV